MVEQMTLNHWVKGSNPLVPTKFFGELYLIKITSCDNISATSCIRTDKAVWYLIDFANKNHKTKYLNFEQKQILFRLIELLHRYR